tara:strand:+ start:794 stop:1885 length:1092 start_codon:yes stop_codon:yes gene_type:complete
MSLVPKHIKELSPYKPGKTIESVKRKFNLNRIIKLASNENPVGPSKKSIDAVYKDLKNSHRYPDSSGLLLREKLADKFNLKIDNVILGNGSEGIMSAIIRTFLKEKDEIITAQNSFIGFRVLANASGKKVHWVQMKNHKYDLLNIAKKINDNTKIIYIANPDNPTGTYINIKEFDEFMINVPNRVLIILDEAYFEYAQFIKDYPDSMFYRYDNVITLRTFSKIYGLAGFRVGYGFAHSDLINNLLKVKLPFEPSSSAQIAAISAIDDEEHLNESINLNRVEMRKMKIFFEDNEIDFIDSVANFLTINFENREEVLNCTNFLLSKGVIVRDLIGFGLPNYIRITIGNTEENNIFIKMFKEYLNK